MNNYIIHLEDLPDNLNFENNSLAIDTETIGLNIKRDRLCLVQLSSNDRNVHLVKFNNDSKYSAPNLKKMLESQDITKIFHYARFDMTVLKYYLNISVKNVFCTKISSYFARTYSSNHGLKTLCEELLNIKISKQQQSSYWGENNLSKEQVSYAASDVLYLHAIKEKLEKILIAEDRMNLAQECFNFLKTRVEMDIQGWEKIDIFSHNIYS